MSCYHRSHCCKPCCCKVVKRVRRRRPRGNGILLAGLLLLLASRLISPAANNVNTNIIKINSDDIDDIYDTKCKC